MEREPIRIRLIPREPVHEQQNAREAFWRAIRREEDQNDKISDDEAKLCLNFGYALRDQLIRELSAPLRSVENTMFRGEFGDLEHLLFRFGKGFGSEKNGDQAQLLDAYTRLLEQRQQFFRDNPALRRVQEKIAAVGSITFSARIAGYSSLNLDLSVGSLKNVAEVFENDFESFRIFLEAFVPHAFADVFNRAEANRLDCTVQVPESYAQAFSPVPTQPSASLTPVAQAPATARDRAEWLWKLANGSLLVPVFLSLFVMYEGVAMLKEIHASQNEALKPVLEHQLKLLEEDRRRLFKEPSTTPASSSASITSTK